MKTYSNILSHSPTNTAPLAAQIERLCAFVIALIDGGMQGAAMRAVVQAASKAQRLVREFCKAEFANHQAERKLDMLSHKHWRRLVLKELGGAKALARWGAATQRCDMRTANTEEDKPAQPSAWRKTPERMAEELRQKEHARKCARAYAAKRPNISRDPFKMDSDGQFRLPPLPRMSCPRDPEAAWATPFDITEYRYDATPVTKVSGYAAPIMVWPAEFEAAELWDYERWLRERRVTMGATEGVDEIDDSLSFVIPDEAQADDPGSNPEDRPLLLDPGFCVCSSKHQAGMTEVENCSPSLQTKKEDPGLRPVNSELSPASA